MIDELRHIRPFGEWLTAQRQGALNVEAGFELNQLVEAVRDTNKGGTLILTIRIEPGKGNSLEVTDKVTIKPPQHDRETALWFADDHGNLTRVDPRQPQLPLGPRAVPPPTGVDADTGEITEEKQA